MQGYKTNIEKETRGNEQFRKVLYTGRHSQLVLMSLLPQEEIGLETHPERDQFFRFEMGVGTVIIDGREIIIGDGDVVIVPAGAKHNVINVSKTEVLKLYTIYSPPEHKDGAAHATKIEAQTREEHFDGKTTE